MPREDVMEAIETGDLIVKVDDERVAGDPFKLDAPKRAAVEVRLPKLKAEQKEAMLAEGGEAGAQTRLRNGLDRLGELLRQVVRFYLGLTEFQITSDVRLEILTNLGFPGEVIGVFDDARTRTVAQQAIDVNPTITNPAHQIPAGLLTAITTELAIVNANLAPATGTAQVAHGELEAALGEWELAESRVRYSYCGASDELDRTQQLARINKQPRREAGEVPQLPGAPGLASFDAATLTLSVAALPEHANTLRAFRQPAGGEAQWAGSSPTTTVSVVDRLGPLTPGVSYQLWVVGHNGDGNGPASNHVSHTA